MDGDTQRTLLWAVCLVLILLVGRLHYPNRPPVFFTIEQVNPRLVELTHPAHVYQIQGELAQATQSLEWQRGAETELYPIGPDGTPSWDIIPIYAFGKWIPQTRPYFPKLLKILTKIPGLQTVLFSRMKGYTCLTPHQGWAVLANRVIRCHLGITVPGEAFISVDGQRRYHQAGKLILFDDSHLHYAANLSSQPRTVLLVDVARPKHLPPGISQVQTSARLVEIVRQFLPGVTIETT